MKMTREIEDALRKANVPEDAIAKLGETADVETLALEELDGVAGGAELTVNMGGEMDATQEEFDTLMLMLAEKCGFGTALGVFKQYCGGFMCDETQPGYSWDGSLSDKDKMALILYRYWLWRITGLPYAHP